MCAGVCAIALVFSSIEKFFLRRSLRRHLKRANSLPLSDSRRTTRELQRSLHLARYAQTMPSWRGSDIVQLGQILEDICLRQLTAFNP